MPGLTNGISLKPLIFLGCTALLLAWAAAPPAHAQATPRAEPVTGPDVTTIGGIAPNARVNVRGGPATMFPVVGTIGYGTRVRMGRCIGGGTARWCQIEAVDGSVSGYVAGRFLVQGGAAPPAGDIDGGPDFWAVQGLPAGSPLNVRRDPSAASPALATLREGEIVRNLGCRVADGARWCRIGSITGMDVTGWVAGRYLRESRGPAVVQPPIAGGPDFYVVSGLPAGDTLNIRAQPSAQSTVLGRLAAGARVRNLGCQQTGQTRWCRIQTTGGVEVTGWVNGRYLREG
ncbi:SH3 domain-containing protein [Rhodovulum strictum]|nr:SH3 domain-containing protein [Rhodovulum strictum]